MTADVQAKHCSVCDSPREWVSYWECPNGHDAAHAELTRLQPLLEAARAYRDARRSWDTEADPITSAAAVALMDTLDALCEAARTFEASHVEED